MISFSVIIPNYNHSSYLKQRIDSVLDQSWPDFEVILLDDRSTDNSRQVIDNYKDHPKVSCILYNEKNSGSPFLQWSKGMEQARHDWIWIAESDDFADPSFLEEAAKAIEQSPSVGIFYCDSFTVNESGKPSEEKLSVRKNKIFNTGKWSNSYCINGIDEINEFLKFDCTVNNISAVVFRKPLFENDRKLLNDFIYYGDWAFLIKASFLSGICYSNKALNYYRKHDASHLNSETSVLISRQEYFKILRLLYYNDKVTGKKGLLNHFTYNYLSFGLSNDGIKKSWRILKYYFRVDRSLALKVAMKLGVIILFRVKRPFYNPGKGHKK
jgi:glycosyltransferase involved in cell wall biosynthesis